MISQIQLFKNIILLLFKNQYSDYFLVFIYLVTKLVSIKLVTKLFLIMVTQLVFKLVYKLVSKINN